MKLVLRYFNDLDTLQDRLDEQFYEEEKGRALTRNIEVSRVLIICITGAVSRHGVTPP